jgi:hypothetical protein
MLYDAMPSSMYCPVAAVNARPDNNSQAMKAGCARPRCCCKVHAKDCAPLHLKTEGRKITHHSSRLGLIGWTSSIQIIKTIHHKMCNTNNVQPPHELLHGHNVCTKHSRISVPNRLQGRALKHKVALIPNNLLGTKHAQTLGPRNPGLAARDIRQTMTSHPELQK